MLVLKNTQGGKAASKSVISHRKKRGGVHLFYWLLARQMLITVARLYQGKEVILLRQENPILPTVESRFYLVIAPLDFCCGKGRTVPLTSRPTVDRMSLTDTSCDSSIVASADSVYLQTNTGTDPSLQVLIMTKSQVCAGTCKRQLLALLRSRLEPTQACHTIQNW